MWDVGRILQDSKIPRLARLAQPGHGGFHTANQVRRRRRLTASHTDRNSSRPLPHASRDDPFDLVGKLQRSLEPWRKFSAVGKAWSFTVVGHSRGPGYHAHSNPSRRHGSLVVPLCAKSDFGCHGSSHFNSIQRVFFGHRVVARGVPTWFRANGFRADPHEEDTGRRGDARDGGKRVRVQSGLGSRRRQLSESAPSPALLERYQCKGGDERRGRVRKRWA